MKHRLFALAFLLLAACSGDGRFIADESIDDAEIRVIIARTSQQSDVKALTHTEPYEYRAERLKDVFTRGDALRVWVFAFKKADLRQRFPALSEDPGAIVEALNPVAEETSAGKYAPPTPYRVLSAVIDADADEDVEYKERDWQQLTDSGEVQLSFQIAGESICPPVRDSNRVPIPFRVFQRDAPGTVCIFQRNDACEWERAAHQTNRCENINLIFPAGLAPEAQIYETPDRSLVLPPNVECTRITAQPGESLAWDCSGKTVAVQHRSGVLSTWLDLQTYDEDGTGQFLPAPTQTLLAYKEPGSRVAMRRITIVDNQRVSEPLKYADASYEYDWAVAAGDLERISRDAEENELVVHATLGTFRSHYPRLPNRPDLFEEPEPIVEPPGLVGDVIAGRSGVYALVANGVQPVDWSGTLGTLLSAGGATFTAQHEIARVRDNQNADRIIVWRPGSPEVYVFGASGTPTVHTIEGTIFAFFKGPEVVYQPTGREHEVMVLDLSSVGQTPTRYVIPSIAELNAEPVEVATGAVFVTAEQRIVGYRAGKTVGFLDLSTGLSITIERPEPSWVPAVLSDESDSQIWAVVTDASSPSSASMVLYPTD